MSTEALQCLSTTVCASLPEPIHPCALLPPNDPDVNKFPDIYNSIQNFKLTKPTWSDYTERCLGGSTAVPTAVPTDTTSQTNTVVGGSKTFDWIIPLAIVGSLIAIIVIIFIIYKTCHNTKRSTNAHLSYHDSYRVDGGDQTGKGGNSETFEQTSLEVIVNSNSITEESKGSTKTSDSGIASDGTMTSDSGIASDGTATSDTGIGSDGTMTSDRRIASDGTMTSDTGITSDGTMISDTGIASKDLQIPQALGAAKSKEHLVKQDKLCPKPADDTLAYENVSFTKDNEKAQNQAHDLTKPINCVDVLNGLQQSPVSDQREQDFSNTTSEEACVSEMECDGDDKDQGQSKSNDVIPLITETSDIKSNFSSNPKNNTDPQLKVNNVDSPRISYVEGTDTTESRTPESADENSNRLQNGIESPGDDLMDKKSDLISHGAPSPGGENCVETNDVTNDADDLSISDSDAETVNLRGSNGYSNSNSSTNDSRQSDLRSDLENLINSF